MKIYKKMGINFQENSYAAVPTALHTKYCMIELLSKAQNSAIERSEIPAQREKKDSHLCVNEMTKKNK
jgi:hypothetical protein